MNLVKYVRQNFCSYPKSNSVLAQVPVRLRKLFPEMFVMISHSLAVCHKQGIWVEISGDLMCKSNCDKLLGFSSLSPTAENKIIPLSQFCRLGMIYGIANKGVTQSSSVSCACSSAVPVPISLALVHSFPPGLSVCLLPTQTLGLCKNGRHTDFAVSYEFLETENPKAVPAKPLCAPCQLLSFANLVHSILIIKILFYPCYASGKAVSELRQMDESSHFHLRIVDSHFIPTFFLSFSVLLTLCV